MIANTLQIELKIQLENFLNEQKNKFKQEDLIKIDMHCHDHNSNEPDELIGRILNVPETWLPTKQLVKKLEKNNCEVITITNHNNARSCYELQEKGIDALTAAEFSCWVTDFDVGIHILAYGFNEKQEQKLNKLRKDVYSFLEYANENDIPTIWAHPLYHYAARKKLPMDFFDKMILVFERFEMLNGQRDTWQNMLVKEWISSATKETIDELAQKFNVDVKKYCKNPYKKSLAGGSDSHMGIFAGQTGTYLYVPNLQKRLQTETKTKLALEAIKNGNMFPYGSHNNSEKLTITFLDYACQIALNYKDPGLFRILLHKGRSADKGIAFAISNLFAEAQKHKVTMSFMNLFHNCFRGKSPSFLKKIMVSSAYKPIFKSIIKIAKIEDGETPNAVEKYYDAILTMNNQLNNILSKRLEKKVVKYNLHKKFSNINIKDIAEKIEIPSYIRKHITSDSKKELNLKKFFDGLSFPFFASTFILSAHFISTKVLYNTRPFLKDFSNKINKFKHPERLLWLTDTFEDKNGVSISLKEMHKEIKRRKLPIDILVCSDTLQPDENLIVVKPMAEFKVPLYEDQSIRIPNFLEVHNLFHKNEYDRIICSTEGIMGLLGLYLKNAYSVPASFFIHTDWIMFCEKVLDFSEHSQNQVRRFLRMYYGGFDRLFVLNTEQKKWLNCRTMGFSEDKVCLTAHWVDKIFEPKKVNKTDIFGVANDAPVMLYVGRVSQEKGVLELPAIYKKVKKVHPNVELVVVGQGPAYDNLKKQLPHGIFFNWIEHSRLPDVYSAADIFVFPSKFDTFANVVLESLSCGLPVIAYNTKGPKDIIEDGICGYLVDTEEVLIEKIISHFKDYDLQQRFRNSAYQRAKLYDKNNILNKFIKDLDFASCLKH